MTVPLAIQTVVETAIYGHDLAAMEAFYTNALGFKVIESKPDRHVFFYVGSSSVLLIFNPETTTVDHHVPPHGANGPGHLAFGIAATDLDNWREKLKSHNIEIEQEIHWPRGGRSLYFRDPAGNSVELITPGVWGTEAGW